MVAVRAKDGRNRIFINKGLLGKNLTITGFLFIAFGNSSLYRKWNLGIRDNGRKKKRMGMPTGRAENTCNARKDDVKRIVIIIDEAHRSTFGEMLTNIKNTFIHAIIFGFTGTPIQDDNSKKDNTTTTIFGDELHRYTLGDGIRDKNVLGFDPYMESTFLDIELREQVALMKVKAQSYDEVKGNPKKEKIYFKFMDPTQVKMYGEQ